MSDNTSLVETLGLITCERPLALSRGLSSHIENRRRFDRSYTILVIDDSRECHIRKRNKELIILAAAKSNVPVRYVGYEEKCHFIRRLIKLGGIDPKIVQFALLGNRRYGIAGERSPVSTSGRGGAGLCHFHAGFERLRKLETLCGKMVLMQNNVDN